MSLIYINPYANHEVGANDNEQSTTNLIDKLDYPEKA